MAPRVRDLFFGRGRRDTLVWIAAIAMAMFVIWLWAKGRTSGGAAIGVALMVILYTFNPWIKQLRARQEAARLKKLFGTVTIDDWGVTRVCGDVREAIAWTDLDWVGIRTTDEGPWQEDFFYLLGDAAGKGVLVPNFIAIELKLMDALHDHLPGIDFKSYKQLAAAVGSTADAVFTIWKRPETPASSPPAGPN